MNLTESKLYQIILEETIALENEDKLIELYLEAFRKYGTNEVLLKEDWFNTATAAVAIGVLGGLFSLQQQHSAEKEAKWQARAAEAAEVLGSLDTKTAEMEKQLKNMNAWTWTDDADPGSREMFPMIEFEDVPELEGTRFTVMPPEYSVFLQVMKDKQSGTVRYGMPDSMQDIQDLQADIKDMANNSESNAAANSNRIDFTDNFAHPELYDLLSKEVGVYGVGGQVYAGADGKMNQAQAITPDFEALENYYGGPLPLSGLSLEDTYNSIMFGGYLSNDEIQNIETQLDDSTELNPELIQKTKSHGAEIEKTK